MMLQRLKELVAAGLLRQLDYQLAAVLADAGETDEKVLLAAALVSERLGQGDVCVDLARVAGVPLFDSDKVVANVEVLQAPALEEWATALRASDLVSTDTTDAPLVLDGIRLYLGRYHRFEVDLGTWIGRCVAPHTVVEIDALNEGLDRLFVSHEKVEQEEFRLVPPGEAVMAPPSLDESTIDYQRLAAAIAVLHPFCVISGGPGTGKTTTVARVLALLLRLFGPLRIALAAPTGKASARLGDSLRAIKPQLDLPPELLKRIPDQVLTLHRLLGLRGDKARPVYHRDNPLHCDLLVVDEASMVDLPLMARLVDALGENARLILLGDKDQLASVEAGSVLGDICDSGNEHAYSPAQAARLQGLCGYRQASIANRLPPMADAIALLRHSYRFDDEQGIGRLARQVNKGDKAGALNTLQSGSAELLWQPDLRAGAQAELVREAVDGYTGYLEHSDPEQALRAFGRLRILCALRSGPQGVKSLNSAVEDELSRRGLIQRGGVFYRGRPIMVTRNDYGLKLFNGDVGLLLPDPHADGALRAFFQMPDGELRSFAPGRLPEYETVFAMTVHKSQGSEFERVLLVLPVEPTPVLTRELVYTGITRARSRVHIAATEAALCNAIEKRNERVSGLRERIWQG